MTVYLPQNGKTWRYDFWYKNQRHVGSTDQTTKADAEAVEAEKRRDLRLRAGGILPPAVVDTPRIHEWAEVYLDHVTHSPRVSRPDRVEDLLRVVLRFWGARPEEPDPKATDRDPYHDLRLAAPITDADWLIAFDDWMDARPISGQTKNQYRSTMSQLYKLASQPKYRKVTGVTVNPFAGIYRDPTGERDVTITPEELRRLLAHASYHVRLAVAIGALAPKLRLGNILGLRWTVHLDRDLKFITIQHHKTRGHTKRPLVMPIAGQLRAILQHAQKLRRGDYVVTYKGRPVQQIRGGVRAAAEAAGLVYGRAHDNGLTFHTLRHTAATLLAELDIAEGKRKSVMGHKRLETTQRYTHLRPMHEVAPLEQLSDLLPIADLVTASWRRASRPKRSTA